jgi:S1-C subfamily serine protease
LLDVEGQVVGTDIENYSSNNLKDFDISFAIPSNSLIKIIPSLSTKGYYLHPWLGAAGADVTPDIAKALNLTESRGFLVISVANLSPAKKTGILGGDNTTSINGRDITLGGDIILKVDDIDVHNIQDISRYIENEKKVGDTIVVDVLRNRIMQTMNVKLGSNLAFLPWLDKQQRRYKIK